VRTIYSSGDWRRAQAARRLRWVRLLGPLERQLASPDRRSRVHAELTIVYQSPDGRVTIFQRPARWRPLMGAVLSQQGHRNGQDPVSGSEHRRGGLAAGRRIPRVQDR
jgi:hypothetical protein